LTKRHPLDTKKSIGPKARNQQQQRYIPKTRAKIVAVQNKRTSSSPLIASPNQPPSLGDSYDYSVPSCTEESQQNQAEDKLEQQPVENNATNNISPHANGSYGMGGGYGYSNSMMMPPMYMGGMMGGVGMGPFSGLYQVLYGVQNVVFSISQAVQLVGMNQELLRQSWESLTKMVDHAIATFHEMRALELHMNQQREETEEDMQRRKRLKALRYALVMGGSWLAYKFIRHLLFYKKNRRRLTAADTSNSYSPGTGFMGSLGMSTLPPYTSSSYHGSGGGYSPYSSMNNNMFNGGGYGYSGTGFY
jgi:hypothetical protein